MSEYVTINLREEYRDLLKKIAKRNHRSMTKQVEWFIEDYLSDHYQHEKEFSIER